MEIEPEYLKERNMVLTNRCEEREDEIIRLRKENDDLRLKLSMSNHPTNFRGYW